MSTHVAPCLVCGVDVACCDDVHVLALGDCDGRPMSLCSVNCFLDLRDRIDDRLTVISMNSAEFPVISEALRDEGAIR